MSGYRVLVRLSVGLLGLLCVLVAVTACGDSRDGWAGNGAYVVLSIRHLNVGEANDRLEYWVLAPTGTSPRQLKTEAVALIEDAQRDAEFGRVWVFFVDREEFSQNGGGPSLGWVRFGPPLREALSARDQEQMELTAHLPAKDWAQRPSIGEVRAYIAWVGILLKAQEKQATGQVDDARVLSEAASRLGMPEADLERTISRTQSWIGDTPGWLY